MSDQLSRSQVIKNRFKQQIEKNRQEGITQNNLFQNNFTPAPIEPQIVNVAPVMRAMYLSDPRTEEEGIIKVKKDNGHQPGQPIGVPSNTSKQSKFLIKVEKDRADYSEVRPKSQAVNLDDPGLKIMYDSMNQGPGSNNSRPHSNAKPLKSPLKPSPPKQHVGFFEGGGVVASGASKFKKAFEGTLNLMVPGSGSANSKKGYSQVKDHEDLSLFQEPPTRIPPLVSNGPTVTQPQVEAPRVPVQNKWTELMHLMEQKLDEHGDVFKDAVDQKFFMLDNQTSRLSDSEYFVEFLNFFMDLVAKLEGRVPEEGNMVQKMMQSVREGCFSNLQINNFKNFVKNSCVKTMNHSNIRSFNHNMPPQAVESKTFEPSSMAGGSFPTPVRRARLNPMPPCFSKYSSTALTKFVKMMAKECKVPQTPEMVAKNMEERLSKMDDLVSVFIRNGLTPEGERSTKHDMLIYEATVHIPRHQIRHNLVYYYSKYVAFNPKSCYSYDRLKNPLLDCIIPKSNPHLAKQLRVELTEAQVLENLHSHFRSMMILSLDQFDPKIIKQQFEASLQRRDLKTESDKLSSRFALLFIGKVLMPSYMLNLDLELYKVSLRMMEAYLKLHCITLSSKLCSLISKHLLRSSSLRAGREVSSRRTHRSIANTLFKC